MPYKALLVTMAIVVGLIMALIASLYAGSSGVSDPSPEMVGTPVLSGLAAQPTETSITTQPPPAEDLNPAATSEPHVADGTATPTAPPTPRSPEAPQPTQTPIPEPVIAFAPPSMLHVPRIGVNAPVEYVARDERGNMDVPNDPWNVAWYEPGTVPGEPGNAVLAGHVDSQSGPAVFWYLKELVPGDHIYVTTVAGEELTFVVVEVAAYDVADVPVRRIFGGTDDRNLNLITCEGTFDQSARDYDQRRVIYTTLVD